MCQTKKQKRVSKYECLKGVHHGWDLNAVPNLKLE